MFLVQYSATYDNTEPATFENLDDAFSFISNGIKDGEIAVDSVDIYQKIEIEVQVLVSVK